MAISVAFGYAARASWTVGADIRQGSKLISNHLVSSSISAKSSSFSSSYSSQPRKLILYSKPGCCLCDGLKEKLQAAFSLSRPGSLRDVDLQIRDITTNPEWEMAYQYEIPVLARVLSDGSEETLPRLSPRLGVELIQKKIVAAFSTYYVRYQPTETKPPSYSADMVATWAFATSTY